MADSSIIFILQKEVQTLDILSSEKKHKTYKEKCMFYKMEIKIQSVILYLIKSFEFSLY